MSVIHSGVVHISLDCPDRIPKSYRVSGLTEEVDNAFRPVNGRPHRYQEGICRA